MYLWQEIAEKVRKGGKEYIRQRLSQSKEKVAALPAKSTVKRSGARVIPLNDDDSGMRPERTVQVPPGSRGDAFALSHRLFFGSFSAIADAIGGDA